MYSISYLRRQVDALQRRLKPVLAILKLRKVALEFCDEFDEAASPELAEGEQPNRRDALMDLARMLPPRVGQAGFRLDTYTNLVAYLVRCIERSARPEPREIVFTLIPWARKGPILRPTLWERPITA